MLARVSADFFNKTRYFSMVSRPAPQNTHQKTKDTNARGIERKDCRYSSCLQFERVFIFFLKKLFLCFIVCMSRIKMKEKREDEKGSLDAETYLQPEIIFCENKGRHSTKNKAREEIFSTQRAFGGVSLYFPSLFVCLLNEKKRVSFVPVAKSIFGNRGEALEKFISSVAKISPSFSCKYFSDPVDSFFV